MVPTVELCDLLHQDKRHNRLILNKSKEEESEMVPLFYFKYFLYIIKINIIYEKLVKLMCDHDIIEICFTKTGKINSAIYHYIENKEEYREVKEYLLNRYNDIPDNMFTYKEVLWRIYRGIEKRPVCQICGNPVEFKGKTAKGKFINGFYKTCCTEHQRMLAQKEVEKTNIDRYGYKTNLLFPETVLKANSSRQTDIAKEKKYNTMLDRYGVKHAFHTKEGAEKAKIITSTYRTNRSKKYNEVLRLLNSNVNLRDYYNTDNEYNVALTLYEKMKNIVDKGFITAKKNNTINTSFAEDRLYELLNKTFIGVIRNYKSDRYNHRCDFYIPEYELFIEYQGSFFHNLHPFDSTDENDIKQLSEIKNKAYLCKHRSGKTKSRYDSLISTWTVSDIIKRNDAKVNHLNYLEIYPKFDINKVPEFIINNYSNKQDLQIIIGI